MYEPTSVLPFHPMASPFATVATNPEEHEYLVRGVDGIPTAWRPWYCACSAY